MQNSQALDFIKILDQTLYTYLPEKLSKAEETRPNVNTYMPENGKNLKPLKIGLVTRLRPVVEYIAISEVIVGSVLMILLMYYAGDYDKLYGTEDSGQISLMTFGGSFFLVFNGIMLLISLKMNKKKVMWSYILTSSLLWVYLFVLSVIKIHFALLVIERESVSAFGIIVVVICPLSYLDTWTLVHRTSAAMALFFQLFHHSIMVVMKSRNKNTYKVVLPERHFFLSNACSLGVTTMLGSVTHFIGNVAVFVYYNLKYIQSMLFNCGP